MDLKTRRGETLPIIWEIDETGADTATITITDGDVVVLTKTVSFNGLTADLTLSNTETDIPVKKYDYMITLVYTDGTVEKYPDVSSCSGCSLPVFEVCKANDEV